MSKPYTLSKRNMKKGAKGKRSAATPMSPALADALRVVDQTEENTEQRQPSGSVVGSGISAGSGSASQSTSIPQTPIMVMDQSAVATFTASIIAAVSAQNAANSATFGSPSSGSNLGTGMVPPSTGETGSVSSLVQFEAGKSQASSLKWHLSQTSKMHFDEIPSLNQKLEAIARAFVMWLTDLQAQAIKFKVDLMLGLGEDTTPEPLTKEQTAARYTSGTPLRGDGQRELSEVEYHSCQVFAAKDLQQAVKTLAVVDGSGYYQYYQKLDESRWTDARIRRAKSPFISFLQKLIKCALVSKGAVALQNAQVAIQEQFYTKLRLTEMSEAGLIEFKTTAIYEYLLPMALLGCPQLTMTRTLSAMPNWLKKWFSSDYLKVRTKVVKWIYLAVSMDNAPVQLGASWGVDADGAGIEEPGSESESEDDLDDYERRKAQKSRKYWPKPWKLPKLCPQVLPNVLHVLVATDSDGKCPLAWLVRCLLKKVREDEDYEASMPSTQARGRVRQLSQEEGDGNGDQRPVVAGGDGDGEGSADGGNGNSESDELRQLRSQLKSSANTIAQLRSRRDELVAAANSGDGGNSNNTNDSASSASKGKGKKNADTGNGQDNGKGKGGGKGGGKSRAKRCIICLSTEHQGFAGNRVSCPEGLKAGLSERPICYSVNLQEAIDSKKPGDGFVTVCAWCGLPGHRLFNGSGAGECTHSAWQNAFPNGRPLAEGASGTSHVRVLESAEQDNGSDDGLEELEEPMDGWDGDGFEEMAVLRPSAFVEQGFAAYELDGSEPAAWEDEFDCMDEADSCLDGPVVDGNSGSGSVWAVLAAVSVGHDRAYAVACGCPSVERLLAEEVELLDARKPDIVDGCVGTVVGC